MTTVQPVRRLPVRASASRRLLPTLALACVLAATTAAGHAQEVHWARIGNECRGLVMLPDSAELFGCGAYGAFLIGGPASEFDIVPGCSVAGGIAVPARYHRETADLSASPSGWTPCAEGSCFQEPGAAERQPWVAVLDWDDGHGWSVGETLLVASDRRVGASLFDLTGARARLPPLGPRVTDVDVLVQLCAVAELAYVEPESKPVAVNMSFGRIPEDPSGCDGPIACEVGGVLDHLYGDLDVVPVAAAGNHGELLFPAAQPAVLSAGALELASFGEEGWAVPSTETPPGVEALVAGYGLFLEDPKSIGDLYPLPAGSTYAAALMAGWIAGVSSQGADFRGRGLDTSGRWQPVAVRGGYGLAFNGVLISDSVLSGPGGIIGRATGVKLEPSCWTAAPEARRAVEIGSPVSALPDLSVADLDADHGPLPGSRPCIPCQGDEPPPPPPKDLLAAGGDLLLNLQASLPLPADLVLHQVYLRAGSRVYQLVPLAGTPAELHDDLGAGRLEQLLIVGLTGVVGPQEQLSLVLTMSYADSPEVWDSVPIAVHSLKTVNECDDTPIKGGL